MKNIHLVIASCLISIILIYTVLFIYTLFNFDKEFGYTFKTSENLNFHQKYSKKLHHIREEITLDLLFKKPKVRDLLFTTINNIEDKEIIVLFQGDSWMEQLTSPVDDNFISVKLVQQFKSQKKVGFINAGTGSYSPSLMSLQLDVLDEEFKIFPNVIISYIDQTDIGDENCRYKYNKTYKNGILESVQPEAQLMYRDIFNYSEIYGLSKIYLKNNSKILKTYQLINFKFKYNLKKNFIRFYRKYISNLKSDKDRLKKCYGNEMQKYLINPSDSDIKYFEDAIEEYINKIEQKKHIKKIILVTAPHKKNFDDNSDQKGSYKLNVSDVVDDVIKNKKNITHINFSKILLSDKNFDHKNIWHIDDVHLNSNFHGKLFMRKILDELSNYLL
tara:strand:+ start:11 stop:1174 length:1164 start_codon:yes stop_codon:yes gene_type:complete